MTSNTHPLIVLCQTAPLFHSFRSERDTVPGHCHGKCTGAGLKGIYKTGLWVHQSRGQSKCNHGKINKPEKFGLEGKGCEQSTTE